MNKEHLSPSSWKDHMTTFLPVMFLTVAEVDVNIISCKSVVLFLHLLWLNLHYPVRLHRGRGSERVSLNASSACAFPAADDGFLRWNWNVSSHSCHPCRLHCVQMVSVRTARFLWCLLFISCHDVIIGGAASLVNVSDSRRLISFTPSVFILQVYRHSYMASYSIYNIHTR